MQLSDRVELALAGVRLEAPVQRSKGAGPSDDGHLWLDGGNAALPINPASPYSIENGLAAQEQDRSRDRSTTFR